MIYHADDAVQSRCEHVLVNRRASFQLIDVVGLDQAFEFFFGCQVLVYHIRFD